ncbi:YjbE family integral membrane protein [Thermodesulfitimonas autotrophica]|uniref:YjbE family integral membrane protein n=1 Tax=Thermodesulfitimonas autotrophica TaxID=1894989 RepID=A0A3N5B1Z8_9THEO|nr:TerC family protein [Thermodesulfitimonas autotrophica]RPF49650.1 YjbE family integral membrane protein [Thermodesulfitimonas autotrophica]
MDFLSAATLFGVFTIVLADLLLAGDNALVIGMACRGLPPAQKKKALIWGTASAIFLRVVLTSMATLLLLVPFLSAAGGLLLIWVALKLVGQEKEVTQMNASKSLFEAIKMIIVADAVMSLDNVLAVAGAAHGNICLVIFGLLLSIPILISGSQLVSLLVEKYPLLLFVGAAVLAWTAGKMLVEDRLVHQLVANSQTAFLPVKILVPATVTVLVLIAGWVLYKREKKKEKTLVRSIPG